MEDLNKRVSVIIPAYKSGEYLWQAIQSVLAQSYGDIELIICDDGTQGFDKDKLEKRLVEVGTMFSYQIIHQTDNLGTVKNLNIGLQYATGKWVLFLSADDVLSGPDVVVRLVEQICESNSEWIAPKSNLCDNKMEHVMGISPNQTIQKLIENGNRDTLYYFLCLDCCIPASGALYYRDLLTSMGGFDEEYRLVEDWPIFLKLIRAEKLPILSCITVLNHRSGGVSSYLASKNLTYQRDLIKVMETEILPNLSCLGEVQRTLIIQKIEDKSSIFEFRFQTRNIESKLWWLVRHQAVVLRRLKTLVLNTIHKTDNTKRKKYE